MANIEYLPIAVRALALGEPKPSRRSSRKHPVERVLVIDTETTTDLTQRLVFGSSRLYVVRDGLVRKKNEEPCSCGSGELTENCHRDLTVHAICVAEHLFYADDLPDRDKDTFAVLSEYAKHHRADIGPQGTEGQASITDSRLHFLPLKRWLDYVWAPYVVKKGVTVVGFNLPFDLSRLARHAAPSRAGAGNRDMAGGFSFQYFESNFRPWLAWKSLDSKKALVQLRSGHPALKDRHRGSFIDTRTLGFALTNSAGSLLSMGKAFKARTLKTEAAGHGTVTESYIDYHRNDVAATAALLECELSELYRHPVPAHPTRAFSPASIAKAYLEAMGVRPVLERQPSFSKKVLGVTMSAFYGGRAEVHLRKQPALATLVDFTSMYPTVDALLGVWGVLTAAEVICEEATASAQEVLDSADLEWLAKRENWRQLLGVAEIVPDGDILPVRARYVDGSPWNIGLNHVYGRTLSGEEVPLWYTLADLVASKLLTGKAPKVRKAYKFRGKGKLPGLRPVRLRGEVRVDPVTEDFFTAVVEARQALGEDKGGPLGSFLKVEANSGSYGIYVEMTRQDHTDDSPKVPVTLYGHTGSPEPAATYSVEELGKYFFAPIAACITGGARLMLATLEHQVTGRGGQWVFCDTDSMAIVTGEGPGALSPAQVDEVRAWYQQLSPYGDDIELLKLETVGHCYAISAKRYCFYEVLAGRACRVIKYSGHGLGHLKDPRSHEPITDDYGLPRASPENTAGWVRKVWEFIVDRDVLGLGPPEPEFFDALPVSAYRVSTSALLRPFRGFNAGKDYRDQVKPANFILVCATENAEGRYIAPAEADPAKWRGLDWRDLDGNPVTHLARHPDGAAEAELPGFAQAASIRAVVARYAGHPEAKFNGPDGRPCHGYTRGVLQRKHIAVASLDNVGKESNLIEEVTFGLADEEDALVTYPTAGQGQAELDRILSLLVNVPNAEVAARCNVSAEHVRLIRSGKRRPSPRVRQALKSLAADVVGLPVHSGGRMAPRHYQELLQTAVAPVTCAFPNCSAPPRSRSLYCSEKHRKAASRATKGRLRRRS